MRYHELIGLIDDVFAKYRKEENTPDSKWTPYCYYKNLTDAKNDSVGAHGGHVEADGPLDAVQVVVQAGIPPHEQRRGHPAQVQGVGQLLLEVVLDELDGQLGVEGVQRRRVALRYRDAVHGRSPLMFQYGKEYTPPDR